MPPDMTHPPCMSCHAHDELEDEFIKMKSRNYEEHEAIGIALAKITTSNDWIIKIGASLVGGIGIIFLMVWALHTKEHTTEKNIVEIKTKIEYIGTGIKETKSDIYRKIKECQNESW